MKPGRIRRLIQDNVDDISTHCEKISGGFDKDTIHKFRVAVKTLRSFLRLLSTGKDEPVAKLPRKFKRLYEVAGAIRDAQLEIERLTTDNISLPVYLKKLENDIERQKTEWDNYYSKKVIRKLRKRLDNLDYTELSTEVAASFFNERIASVAKASAGKAPTNVQLHSMRKKLKDLVYGAKLLKKEWKGAYKEIALVPIKKIEVLATDIGEFNDARLIFEHLSSFSSPRLEAEEINTISAICSREQAHLKKRKKAVLSELRLATQPMPASA